MEQAMTPWQISLQQLTVAPKAVRRSAGEWRDGRAPMFPDKKCSICGTTFTPVISHQLTCGPVCKQTLARNNRRARVAKAKAKK